MEGTARADEQYGVAQTSGAHGAGLQAHGRPGPARQCCPRKWAPEAKSTAKSTGTQGPADDGEAMVDGLPRVHFLSCPPAPDIRERAAPSAANPRLTPYTEIN